MNIENFIVDTFFQYAYQPANLYIVICLIMTASSFGLPIPEEFTLVTAGLIAYMGMHPEKYPEKVAAIGGVGEPVNLYTLALVCFLAVLLSDILIYTLGRFFGDKLFKSKFFSKKVGSAKMDKINGWFQKYSIWVCGAFRFMPGIRFFGHMTCGAMKIPVHKFIAIDGLAALISVPTQVLVVAFYGEVILAKIKEFKLLFLGVLVVVGIVYLVKYLKNKKASKYADKSGPV
ncbi:MAG: membrane protein DedA with SNARE-associated domain [Thermoproteota archaeon]|jgi:membrane protein DedA with SNARE-associated domain